MKTIELPSQEQVKRAFEYTEETFWLGGRECRGGLRWKFRPEARARTNSRCAGKIAGCYNPKINRIVVRWDNNLFYIYRLIWVYHNEFLPEDLGVDHADQDPLNNRISNLRLANDALNNANKRKFRGVTSVYKGVDFISSINKWRAQTSFNGKVLYLGTYNTEIDAAKARDERVSLLYGPFAHLNFPIEID